MLWLIVVFGGFDCGFLGLALCWVCVVWGLCLLCFVLEVGVLGSVTLWLCMDFGGLLVLIVGLWVDGRVWLFVGSC